MEEQLCVDTIRMLAADMVQAANSGHPGAPMGMAPMAHVLFARHMRCDPTEPRWANRDRFVLSNGHACALQYSLLHLLGYRVSMDDLKAFRQLGSITPGHPEVGVTDGIEVTTGPLGQGIANAVGLAMAQAHMAAVYNRPGFELFDNFTYCFCGDGCLQEGISGEASSLAGHWRLGRLIVLYDDNNITIDGSTHLSFTEDVAKRYEAYGWHVQTVHNGNERLDAIDAAITEAKAVRDRPSIICVKTIIGYGAANQDTAGVHGSPLGKNGLAFAKQQLGRADTALSFHVPDPVYARYAGVRARGRDTRARWAATVRRYEKAFPKEAAELRRRLAGQLPDGALASMPSYKVDGKGAATRATSGKCIGALAPRMPELIIGSADLTPSNKTDWKGCVDFQAATPAGRYVRYGVREHAMGAIGNGLAAYGGFIPATATFLNFIEYMFPAVRLAALSHLRQLFVMTHDSILLAEDGPTHQPIEALNLCRATPNVLTLRPCDGNETTGAYAVAVRNAHGPSVLALSRQGLPTLAGSSADKVAAGAYVLQEPAGGARAQVILVATGSEVSLCVAAAKLITGRGVRIVSMPCQELFDAQPPAYRRAVLTPGVPVVSVETASVTGWERYAHFSVGMNSFGASAPGGKVADHFGFTAPKVARQVQAFLAEYADTMRQLVPAAGGARAGSGSASMPPAAPLPTHFASTRGNQPTAPHGAGGAAAGCPMVSRL